MLSSQTLYDGKYIHLFCLLYTLKIDFYQSFASGQRSCPPYFAPYFCSSMHPLEDSLQREIAYLPSMVCLVKFSATIMLINCNRCQGMDGYGASEPSNLLVHLPTLPIVYCWRWPTTTASLVKSSKRIRVTLPHPLSQPRHCISAANAIPFQVSHHRSSMCHLLQHREWKSHGGLPILATCCRVLIHCV